MNLSRFMSFLRYALFAGVALSMVVISGCDDDDDGPTVYNGTTLQLMQDAQFKQSATVGADVALDSLVKYLTIYPELTALLSGAGEVTAFAPSNTAFINLLATPGFPSNIELISPDIIKGVLSYHIVSGKELKADLTSGTQLNSSFTDPLSPAAPQVIIVNANGTLKTGSTNQDIDIVDADNLATNGVIHVVESVMIPPSVGATLTPILGTMAGTILLGKDFTNLAKIILAADNGFAENPGTGTFKVSTWLAMPITNATTTTANAKGFTFFAPPNAIPGATILSEATANAIIASADKGRSFLLNHLVTSGQYTVADPPATNPNEITKFTTGPLTPASGKTITVVVGNQSTTNPYGVALSNTPADALSFRPIVSPDLGHSNGTIQVFAGALQ